MKYIHVYRICSNSETSGPALRYLRSQHDFIYRQLAELEIPDSSHVTNLYLKTYGWLLKLVSLELHITTQAKQRSNQLRLVKLLFQRSNQLEPGISLSSTVAQDLTMINGQNLSSLLICDIFNLGITLNRQLLYYK